MYCSDKIHNAFGMQEDQWACFQINPETASMVSAMIGLVLACSGQFRKVIPTSTSQQSCRYTLNTERRLSF